MFSSRRISDVFIRKLKSNRYVSNIVGEGVKVAIIGSGPSGFYTAKYLLDQDPRIHVDVYEKLPFPYGLVRYGVAPDHPEVKTVTNTFEQLFHDSACRDRIRYCGNVEISDESEGLGSNQIPLSSILQCYSATVLAYGAHSDHNLRLPNEFDYTGVLSSREFVNWYNGHPEYKDLHLSVHFRELSKQNQYRPIKDVIIVGQGNVALDCARLLVKDIDELARTDITEEALKSLKQLQTNIERVMIVGRRGYIQAAFTIKELRELSRLNSSEMRFNPDELKESENPASLLEIKDNRPKKRIVELIQNISKSSNSSVPVDSKKKIIDFRYLLSPTELIGSPTGHICAISFTRNMLTGESNHQKAIPTEEKVTLPCDLLIKSIGYKSVCINKLVPFDTAANVVINNHGKVIANNQSPQTSPLYVTGWLKRGATGIIGTNISDAKETVASLISDLKNGNISLKASDPIQEMNLIDSHHQKVIKNSVNWNDVQILNQLELERGEKANPQKIREKFASIQDMLEIVSAGRK
jgi:adrenodoxin-NADP+ reductase